MRFRWGRLLFLACGAASAIACSLLLDDPNFEGSSGSDGSAGDSPNGQPADAGPRDVILKAPVCGEDGGYSAYWPFDEGDGGLVKDCKGNYNGALSPASGWVSSGHHGAALWLDGGIVNMGPGPASGSNQFTVSAWVYIPAVTLNGGGRRVLVSKGDCGVGWSIFVKSGALGVAFGQAYKGCENAQTVSRVIPPDTWTHIAVALNLQKTVTLCVNGACSSHADSGAFVNSDQPFRVGIGQIGTVGTFQPTQGPFAIDELTLYRPDISVDQIAALAAQ